MLTICDTHRVSVIAESFMVPLHAGTGHTLQHVLNLTNNPHVALKFIDTNNKRSTMHFSTHCILKTIILKA